MRKGLMGLLALLVCVSIVGAGCGNIKAGNTEDENVVKEPHSVTETSHSVQGKKLKLKFEDGEMIVDLYDNPTSRDFVAMLPMTVTLQDFNKTEKIGYLSRKLSLQLAPDGFKPTVGDFAYYAPWGNLSIFYHDFRYSQNLISLGRIQSGVENLANKNGDIVVSIELLKE